MRPLRVAARAAERDEIILALRATNGNHTEAAKLLRIMPKTLRTKMTVLGVPKSRSKE